MLELWDTEEAQARPADWGDQERIDGILDDQKYVALLDCSPRGYRATFGFNGFSHRYRFFPHFGVVGGIRFSGKVSRVSFVFDTAKSLFYDRDAFGSLHLSSDELRALLRRAGTSVDNEAHPFVDYWTGRSEVLSAETTIGKIVVGHRVTIGRSIKNKVVVHVDLSSPATVWDLPKILGQILRFFGILMGRPVNLLELELHQEDDSGQSHSSAVYLNMMRNRPKSWAYRKPEFHDVLIDAASETAKFSDLMSAWLDRDKTWNIARSRFMDGWRKQRDYDSDRLVSAANMFDLLPEEAVPTASALSPELSSVITEAQGLLQAISSSEKRDGILGYLGQITGPSLKQKIRHRATFVTSMIGEDLPQLDMVINAAVDLRNLYVHGDKPDSKRAKLVNSGVFLTNTLEFIFAASDLVESGWDLASWRQQGFSHHPFSNYLRGYSADLAQLRTHREK